MTAANQVLAERARHLAERDSHTKLIRWKFSPPGRPEIARNDYRSSPQPPQPPKASGDGVMSGDEHGPTHDDEQIGDLTDIPPSCTSVRPAEIQVWPGHDDAGHCKAVAEFRDRRKADQATVAGALILEVADVLARAMLGEPASLDGAA